jgi:hypothetical protein
MSNVNIKLLLDKRVIPTYLYITNLPPDILICLNNTNIMLKQKRRGTVSRPSLMSKQNGMLCF